jgi:hypothetical protein
LTRPDGDGVGIEELDNLQMEIESLLVDAMQRTRTFKLQIMLLENGDESVLVKSKSTTQPPSLQTTPYKTHKRNKLANSKLMSTPNASSKPVSLFLLTLRFSWSYTAMRSTFDVKDQGHGESNRAQRHTRRVLEFN